MKRLFLFIALFMTILACEKETPDLAPSISLQSVAPTLVQEFTDSIVFIINYEDYDGDLGFPNADSLSLWILDQRLNTPDRFFIPPLAPLTEEVHIQGEFRLVLPNTFRLGTGPQETTSFDIWIKDRKGNISNTITSPLITITE